jgi:hypothetical protein
MSVTFLIACALATALILFTSENLWVDRLVRSRWHRLPSLVPAEGSTGWALAFGLMGISCVLLLVCQIFVWRVRGLGAVKKWGTMCLTLSALTLFGLWFWTTGMGSSAASLRFAQKQHSVTLTWKASTSVVDGYNVYRRELPNGPLMKINDKLEPGLSFVDRTVKSGFKYSYVVRAVARGRESKDSNPAEADVP